MSTILPLSVRHDERQSDLAGRWAYFLTHDPGGRAWCEAVMAEHAHPLTKIHELMRDLNNLDQAVRNLDSTERLIPTGRGRPGRTQEYDRWTIHAAQARKREAIASGLKELSAMERHPPKGADLDKRLDAIRQAIDAVPHDLPGLEGTVEKPVEGPRTVLS